MKRVPHLWSTIRNLLFKQASLINILINLCQSLVYNFISSITDMAEFEQWSHHIYTYIADVNMKNVFHAL